MAGGSTATRTRRPHPRRPGRSHRSGWPGQAGTPDPPATGRVTRDLGDASAQSRSATGWPAVDRGARSAGLRRTARPLTMSGDGDRGSTQPTRIAGVRLRHVHGQVLVSARQPPGARAERSGSERKPEGRGGAPRAVRPGLKT
jgi:hypothetical protein